MNIEVRFIAEQPIVQLARLVGHTRTGPVAQAKEF
jgi:hypothetical protein